MPKKTHREMAQTSPAFRAACERAEIKPTRRQFAKFVNRRGRAWAAHLTLNNTLILERASPE